MVATIVQFLGTGRRKSSVARVFLRPGKGEIKINDRAFENYFPTESARAVVRQPLLATETMDKFDIVILAGGGGVAGQAGAARLGIARALVEFNGELRSRLKKLGLLTRDPRAHERKKYGQKGARKRFQFSKREVFFVKPGRDGIVAAFRLFFMFSGPGRKFRFGRVTTMK